jgi:hypothetical protein
VRLYCALGGGMGHVTRALAFVHTMKYDWKDFIILISSRLYQDLFPADTTVLFPEKENPTAVELQQYLLSIINKFAIDEVFLDAFPCGIVGEWNSFPLNGIRFYYIARILNWDNYKIIISKKSPLFEKVYLVEEISGDQLEYINEKSKSNEFLNLIYPDFPVSNEKLELIKNAGQPVWLIVHSGPEDEVESLYHYAIDLAEEDRSKPLFLICTQADGIKICDNAMIIKDWFIWNIFGLVDKIITGCGFNLMQQTRQYSKKHIFVPFIRKYDDQFLRSKNRKI